MKDLIDNFFSLEKELCKAFGYTNNYRIFPIVDIRDCFWKLDSEQDDEVKNVYYAEDLDSLKNEDEENCYDASIYTYCHLDKWIYRTDKYTMILMNTHCDSNIYFGIFDNTKEIRVLE